MIRKPPYGNYLIRDDPELIERLRNEVEHFIETARNLKPRRAFQWLR